MIIINSLNESRFTLNNVQYFKNYTTRVAGDKLTVYNAYDNKDVLVPLTPFDQFRVNGSVYDTIEELQIAIIGICYTRTTLDEGSPNSQNNIGRYLSFGEIAGGNDYITPTDVATFINNLDYSIVITAIDAPVTFDFTRNGVRYLFDFTPGKGMWGSANGANFGGTVQSFHFKLKSVFKITPTDIEDNQGATIISLGDIPTGDYLTKANSVQRDFNDAGELDENGSVISYYFSYTTDTVLYFVQFVGAAGVYNGTLVADDLVSTTNNNVTVEVDYENVLQTGNFASIGAIHKDADTGMITEFHGGGFGSTLGDYTQKFLIDTPVGNYTITFPAATQNDNVVYESTLHEGLNSLSLQAVIDNGSTATHNDDIIITMDDGSDISKLSMIGDLLKLQLNNSSLSIDNNGTHFNTTVSGIDATANNEFATLGQVNQTIENQGFSDVLAVNHTVYRDYYEDFFVLKNSSEPDAYIKVYADDEWLMNLKLNDGNGNETFIHTSGLEFTYDYGSGGAILNDGGVQLYNSEGTGVNYGIAKIRIPTNDYNFKANFSGLYADYGFEIEGAPNIYYNQTQENDSIYFRAIPNITEGVPWVASGSPYWEIKGDLNIVNSDNPNSRGISADVDFTSNITDLDYVQKKYVDDSLPSGTGFGYWDGTDVSFLNGNSQQMVLGNGTISDIDTKMRSQWIGINTGSNTPVTSSTNFQEAIWSLQAQVENTIPLTGTEEGNPVDGAIEMADGAEIVINDGAFGIGRWYENGGINVHDNGNIVAISSNPTWKGVTYGADYSSNYTNRSLVDKEYTDTKENKGKITQSISSSSTIDFVSYQQFGTRTTPVTVDVTLNTTDATEGIIQVMYHNAASFTPPAGTTIVGNTPYVPNVLNMICMRYTSDTVEIWYTQDQ